MSEMERNLEEKRVLSFSFRPQQLIENKLVVFDAVDYKYIEDNSIAPEERTLSDECEIKLTKKFFFFDKVKFEKKGEELDEAGEVEEIKVRIVNYLTSNIDSNNPSTNYFINEMKRRPESITKYFEFSNKKYFEEVIFTISDKYFRPLVEIVVFFKRYIMDIEDHKIISFEEERIKRYKETFDESDYEIENDGIINIENEYISITITVPSGTF